MEDYSFNLEEVVWSTNVLIKKKQNKPDNV